MQQAQQKPQPQQTRQAPAPLKVPAPKQSQGCEMDRLMAMFDKL